jgi:hypothetical protein
MTTSLPFFLWRRRIPPRADSLPEQAAAAYENPSDCAVRRVTQVLLFPDGNFA